MDYLETSTFSPMSAPPDRLTRAAMPRYSEDSDMDDLGYYATTELEEDDLTCLLSRGISTIARQTHAYTILKSDVALKIMAAGEDSAQHECHMQQEILRSVPGADSSRLLLYLDTFLLEVEEMSMVIRMSAARQLLETLESLHKAGIVHRDLNERNCIWGMARLDNLTRKEKYQALGRPLKQAILLEGLWKQGEIVKLFEVPEHLRTETFYLTDFGLAMKLGESAIPRGRPPIKYCSPDRLHGQDPSFACDMWITCSSLQSSILACPL
ncbi:hypothetical protein AJ79_09086 [Helicocarpus griseus UAMH5409]|uniref:Protein kinase domain-containing protein n=1 Tax=Helicocarpus griseus UAMH5409 TaxID=1447875 RepID=A0A2B7WML8_9EURO|nr:hypothetical protein AJ79_09086 [Helicocarpus griseus UAMH5409]